MATVSALITGAKTTPAINTRPDIQHMTQFCESNGFDIHCIHVNDTDLSSHPKRKVYKNVLDYRRELATFLSKPGPEFLLYYYCGHGSHSWNNQLKRNEEALIIMTDKEQWFYDTMLSEEINQHLAPGKTLIIIVDACHAGGMLNAWQFNFYKDRNVVFLTGAMLEISSWDDQKAPGGQFTNSFLRHVKIGEPIYKIADNILEDIFTPAKNGNAHSPSVSYSRPLLCISKFCEHGLVEE